MSAQRGRDLLLKLDDGAGGFVTVAGLRSRRITLGADTVDVTHAESEGRWRELLAGAGVRRAALAGAGVFRDEASHTRVREVFFAGEIRIWRVVIPAFGTIEGAFQIVTLDYRGDHASEVTFDLALESAGALTFSVL